MGFRLSKALEALKLEYQAKILKATENIRTYENSVGIGEHPDLVEAVEMEVKKIAEAQDMLEAIESLDLDA